MCSIRPIPRPRSPPARASATSSSASIPCATRHEGPRRMRISTRQLHPVFVGEVEGVDCRKPLNPQEGAGPAPSARAVAARAGAREASGADFRCFSNSTAVVRSGSVATHGALYQRRLLFDVAVALAAAGATRTVQFGCPPRKGCPLLTGEIDAATQEQTCDHPRPIRRRPS